MRTSYDLLKTYINTTLSPSDIAEKLTLQGLEVEQILPYAHHLESIIIVKILDAKIHPNADNLTVCIVDNGKEHLQIVCGAKNFKINDKVLLAPIGTVMPNGLEIKASVLRGVESHGMLCSSKELGLFESEGLWILPQDAPIGETLVQWSGIKTDTIYDIALTPNRGDCLGTLGIAREIAILERKSAHIKPLIKPFPIDQSIKAPIVNIDSKDCERYVSRIIQNIKVAPSPLWLKIALHKYGLHSINNIVDISNYVMMELGQPIHIFDLDQMTPPLNISNHHHNKSLVLLSGEEINIPKDILCVEDQNGPIALAGVMGGSNTGISNKTQNVLLEVAYFKPDSIRYTSKMTKIYTDASYHFMRNTDKENILTVMDFLTSMILEVSTGYISDISDNYPVVKQPSQIEISLDFIDEKLGFIIPEKEIQDILVSLGFDYSILQDRLYKVNIPSFRNDCQLPIDIVEEIIRIYGYDKMPITAPKLTIPLNAPLAKTPFIMELKDLLVSYGLQEIYTFSFTKKEQNISYSLLGEESISLQNPLNTDFGYLRTSLFSTVSTYLQNILDKGYKSLQGFEIGNIFYQNLNQELVEHTHLFLFQLGEKTPLNFKKSHRLIDFYDTKAYLEKLFSHLGLSKSIDFRPLDHIPFLHPYKSAGIYYLETYLGFIGEVHPQFWDQYKGKNNLVLSELNLSLLETFAQLKQTQRSYTPISKYPKIERDLAFVLDKTTQSSDIVKKIKTLSPLIISVETVDSYENEKLGLDKKSLGFKIFFQSYSQTLTDEEIQPLITEIIDWVSTEKQGILREF